MRGTVLGLDSETNEAVISGENGDRFRFNRDDWKVETPPRAGLQVDFEVRDDRAIAVYPVIASSLDRDEDDTADVPTARAQRKRFGKNKWIAALLAFPFGVLGLHKFYLGRNKAGMIMMFSTVFGALLAGIPTVIMALISLAELFIYVFKTPEDFHQRYVVDEKSWL